MIYSDERIDIVNDDIKLIQKTNGLTFGTDALLLASFVRSQPSATALDYGAGTGIISFLCAVRNKYKRIVAVEAQSDFAEMIERNIELNKLCNKVSAICCDVRELSFEKLGFEADAIFTNPPYMRAASGRVNEYNIKTIARHEILGDINDFCMAASKNLKHGGRFYAVYRPERMTELFYAMRAARIEPKRLCMVCPDSESAPSLILVEGKKGAAAEIKIEKPLIMYSDKTHAKYTDDFAYIYEHGCFKK